MTKGFSLVESIMAIIIFVLIIVVIYSVYLFNQQAYKEGEKIAEITQNGRVVLERITREVRQAEEIVTPLPQIDQGESNPSEIEFQDGHIPSVSIIGTAQGGTVNTITLSSDSSTSTDYYNGMFIKITGNTGQGQVRKIIEYDGLIKTAVVQEDWDIVPDNTSLYLLGSEYYYIRYYIPGGTNEIHRQYMVYCFDSCDVCDNYFHWKDTRIEVPTSTSPCVLEERIIGEYAADLSFWGSNVINIFITLTKGEQEIDLSTKIFGRNF